MAGDFPDVVVDWDYETYGIDDQGRYVLYDLFLEYDQLPEYVYISGHPWPGKKLERTLAKLIDPKLATYELVKG